MYSINQNGPGDFNSITQAIEYLRKIEIESSLPISLYIHKGIYEEKASIEDLNLHLIGESMEETIIRWNNGAYDMMPDGTKRQTFRTATFYASTPFIGLTNLTIENSAGPGHLAGQAIALYLDSAYSVVTNCRLIGHQDTLFLGPLPPSERIPGSFVGPRENAPRTPTYAQFVNCSISGDIDFIFGSGKADFVNCTLISNDRNETINGYITAASTPEGQEDGFTFYKCNLESKAKEGSVFLGRPWRSYAKVSFNDCQMGAHIHPLGWDLWGNDDNSETVEFSEMNNRGDGSKSDQRPYYVIT